MISPWGQYNCLALNRSGARVSFKVCEGREEGDQDSKKCDGMMR